MGDSKIKRTTSARQPGSRPDVESLVGERVHAIREERGLSQRQLARECGVSSGHISLLERGVVQPTVRTLETLAAQLGVDVVDLIVSPDRSIRARVIAATAQLDDSQLEDIDAWLRSLDGPEGDLRAHVLARTADLDVDALRGLLDQIDQLQGKPTRRARTTKTRRKRERATTIAVRRRSKDENS